MNDDSLQMKSPDAPIVGAASDDDPLWVAQCDLAQIRKLIYDPIGWMKELTLAAGRDPENAPIELRTPFTMKFRFVPQGKLESTKPYLVEGINGTSVLTIRPALDLALLSQRLSDVRSGAPFTVADLLDLWEGFDPKWREYVEEWKKTPIHGAAKHGVGFAHMEITHDDDDGGRRGDKIAAFLVLSAALGGVFLNEVLTPDRPAASQRDTGGLMEWTPAFVNIDEAIFAGITFIYAGTGGPACKACDNMAGALIDSKMALDEVMIKCY